MRFLRRCSAISSKRFLLWHKNKTHNKGVVVNTILKIVLPQPLVLSFCRILFRARNDGLLDTVFGNFGDMNLHAADFGAHGFAVLRQGLDGVQHQTGKGIVIPIREGNAKRLLHIFNLRAAADFPGGIV